MIADFGSGRREYEDEENLLSVLLYGWGFEIFDISIRVGVFFNVDFFFDYVMMATRDLQVGTELSVGTGTKKYELWIRGGWDGLDAGVDTLRDDPAYKTLEFINPLRTPGLEASIDIFSGLAPGVSLELLGMAKLFVRQRNGINLNALADSGGLKPTSDCQSCHSLSIDADLVVENFQVGVQFRFYFDVWWFPTIDISFRETFTLPGELRFDLLALCLGEEQFGDYCGDATSGQCCPPSLICFFDSCSEPYDPYCDNGLPPCGSDCCGDSRTCSLVDGGCVSPPPGAIVPLPRLIVNAVDELDDCFGKEAILVRLTNTLPEYLFEEGPYPCGDQATSQRIHARVVVEEDGEPVIIKTECFLDFAGTAKNNFVFFKDLVLPFQDSREEVVGYIEFYDNEIGFPYRSNGGTPIIFVDAIIT